MSASADPAEPRAMLSRDGRTWDYSQGTGPVVKVVIGAPPLLGDSFHCVRLSEAVLRDLERHLPTITHLHLWGVGGLRNLPALSPSLRCLDLRGCPELTTLPELPAGLETLVLEDCPISTLRLPRAGLKTLDDVSLQWCKDLTEQAILSLLGMAPNLRRFDASRCLHLKKVAAWPAALERIELNHCPQLAPLPPWPERLRRVGLRGATGLSDLPPLPETADYLDLAGTTALKTVPILRSRPRSLFIFGSGLELPNEVFGESETSNAAAAVLAHLGERERVVDDEVKVILVGDGRSGKSSLARRLVEDRFDRKEKTTHGIRLWTLNLPYEPVDEPGQTAMAKLNLWDFAGQDLYHNTHRLFFQSKAIFLLCGNACPAGADPESDKTDDDGLEAHADIHRNLRYWREQVESLGRAPGMDGPPPMLVVRTKSDRDEENEAYAPAFHARRQQAAGALEFLDVSAKSGTGIADLKAWISREAARILGPRGKREIGVNPMKVKRALGEWMAENDAAHRLSERTGPRVASPHPTMGRSGENGFDALVQRLCPTGDYHDSPGLLLERFHLAGFLYYNAAFLKDIVVLDQRWAIAGMYAAFDRRMAWPNLLAAQGRFTSRELAEWNWQHEGFTAQEQSLFLQFMQSCGMAFRLGTLADGQEEYLAPSALPERSAATDREASDHRAGLKPEGEPVVLESPSLSRESVLQLLVSLGREWRRSPVFWRWGGQFQSFRRWERTWMGPRTFVHLDWRERDSESYGGRLILTQYGADTSFLAAILNECRRLAGFRETEVPTLAVPEERVDLAGESMPERGPRDQAAGHQPDRMHAEAVEIGISFAGDQPAPVADWRMLPENSIERWPLALAAALRAGQFKVVEQYREHQSRPEHEKIQGRKPYLDRLISRDHVIVFLSWPYLESPWCMVEFLGLYDRMEDGKQDPAVVRVASFREAMFSQTVRREHPESKKPFEAHFRVHWKKWLEELEGRIVEDSEPSRKRPTDFLTYSKRLESHACLEWAECVWEGTKLDRIVDAIRGDWSILPIGREPDPVMIEKWVEETAENTARYEALLNYAVAAWKRGGEERDHAQRLFVCAFLGGDPDGQPEGLEKALRRRIGVDELDDIRRTVLEEYEKWCEAGVSIQTWQDLAKAVVQTPKRRRR